jgi:hypothetical protein
MSRVLENRFQQMVMVIGAGIALWFLGSFISQLGVPSEFGWVAYAPLSGAVHGPRADLTDAEQLLVWLGLIALWMLLSVLVFRTKSDNE